jgi:glycosyltransferase involved in cell wall biosynthesis
LSTLGRAMRLGILHTGEVDNSVYRAVLPGDAMRRKGHDVRIIAHDDRAPMPMDPFVDRDVVQVVRCRGEAVARLVDQLRGQGIGVTYDDDEPGRLTPEQLAIMRRAHLVTTTTAVLAVRWAETVDRPIEVVPNFLGAQHFARTSRESEGIVVGWIAEGQPLADAGRLELAEILRRVMRKRPDVRVVTVGVALDLDPSRSTHHDDLPPDRRGEHIRRFDVGIAPLADLPTSAARSDVKVKEYAAAGVAWLASDRGPYAALTPKNGGLLVEDDAWEDAILELVTSKWKRLQLRRCGERWARTQRIDHHVARWEAVWQEAAAMAKQHEAA